MFFYFGSFQKCRTMKTIFIAFELNENVEVQIFVTAVQLFSEIRLTDVRHKPYKLTKNVIDASQIPRNFNFNAPCTDIRNYELFSVILKRTNYSRNDVLYRMLVKHNKYYLYVDINIFNCNALFIKTKR